ncbi:MAG: beta-ketoacyl synthase N-terminal-like domain-containing protein [Thermodesulfobacteriota bacterium]
MDKIVITGIGVISSLGFSKEEFWDGLLTGRQGTAPGEIGKENGGAQQPRQLGHVTGFKAKRYMKRPVLKPLDMVTRYAIAGVGQAIADAGLEINETNQQRTGVIAGSMYQGIGNIFKFKKACHDNGQEHLSPLFFPGIVFNSLSGQAAIEYKIKGPNNTIASGTASGLTAVAKGMDYILAGKADTVIAGGAEMIHDFVFHKYERLGRLAQRGADERCRPFAKDRDGFILGEGSCFFVLERESAARARGATIHAVLDGYGAAFCPSPGAEAESLAGCLKRSGGDMAPDIIVSDSSGCHDLDAVEAAAIGKSYGASDGPLITGNKGNIGHSLGASGAFNLCQGVMSLAAGQVAPLTGMAEPEFALNYARQAGPMPVSRVMVNAIDFNNNYLAMSISKPAEVTP